MFQDCWLYEICLPKKYNDGHTIPSGRFYKTKNDFTEKFGACTFFDVRGLWKYYEISLNEENILIQITVERECDEFWEKYFVTLQQRFKQVEIYLRKTQVSIFKSRVSLHLTPDESSSASRKSTGESSI